MIETLFYYLLPETPTSDGAGLQPAANLAKPTSSSSIGSDFLAHPGQLPDLLSGAADFVPQTPVRSRTRTAGLGDAATPSRDRASSSRRSSPSPTPRRRPSSRANSDSTSSSTASGMSRTASPSRRSGSPGPSAPSTPTRRRREAHDIERVDMPPPPVPSARRNASVSRRAERERTARLPPESPQTPRPPDLRLATGSLGAASRRRPEDTRGGAEKRELLRHIMPNVDALQERFKAMGLGV